ncbi:MAG: hypothetical protein AAFO81_15010 [Pseudomonadota bacterium]
MTTQRLVLRIIGVIGAVIFTAFFALTYSVPQWVETFAADYIDRKAQARIDGMIDAIKPMESETALARLSQYLYDKNEAKIEHSKTLLRDRVHEQWASALADITDMDCACRQQWAKEFESWFQSDIRLLRAANDKIADVIHAAYMDVATDLRRDIRIFTASNAAIFLLLLLVSFAKPQAATHLFLPGVLLSIATVCCAYCYLFQQDWLLTIINGSYVGFAYLGWLGIVFAFLCDVVVNRARITSRILNAIFNAVGSALSVVSC